MSDTLPQKQYVQFGTRTLLALTLVSAVLFAVSKWIGPLWALVAGWFALMIGAHVLGNSWGRSNYQRKERDPTEEPPQRVREDAPAVIADIQRQTVKRLERIRLGWLTVGVTLVGLVLGAAVGLLIGARDVTNANLQAINGMALATASCGVLGAFIGFWCSSFVAVFCGFGRAGLEGSAPHRDRSAAAQQTPK